jgi:hypothetical protein
MPDQVKIENLTNRPVLLTLNSRTTLHLPPRETSREIGDVEIKNNPMATKLEDRHVIAIHKITSDSRSGKMSAVNATTDSDKVPPGSRSGEMSAAEAIAHIENTPLEELREFLSEGEDRVTVLRAWEEKHGHG